LGSDRMSRMPRMEHMGGVTLAEKRPRVRRWKG